MSADSLGDGALNLPYEENPAPAELDLSDALIAGGLVVMAATVPTEIGKVPALVFRFVLADGTFLPPVLFACSVGEMRKTTDLVAGAVHGAIRGARA